MTPRVIDLSKWNTVPESFAETKASGVVGVVHKLTEGTSIIDPKVEARRALALDAGLAWGLYHFLRPGSMAEQARYFLDTAYSLNVIDDDTMVAADHEDPNVSLELLKEFLDALEEIGDRSPVVYSGHVLKDQLAGLGARPQRRLWLAQYSSAPTLPQGVEDYWLWQYSDREEVPGIVPPVDANTFEGDDAAFLAGWSGYLPGKIEPEEQLVAIDLQVPTGMGVTVTINGERVV